MDREPTISDVLEAVNDLSTNVDVQFADVRSEIADTRSEITYMKSVMATKEDLTRMATKEDLTRMKCDLVTEIDHFAGLHKKTEIETLALRSRCDRIEARMDAA
jgi:hypothetical protein